MHSSTGISCGFLLRKRIDLNSEKEEKNKEN